MGAAPAQARAPWIVFSAIGEGTQRYYLPGGDAVQNLVRSLAPDVFRHRFHLRKAYVDHVLQMKVLIPRSYLPAEVPESVKDATLMGYPVEVVEDLQEPMIAYALKIADI